MLSDKCFNSFKNNIKKIENSLYCIRCDFSNKKVMKAYITIALYNINEILDLHPDNDISESDKNQLIHLKKVIKKFDYKDGRYFRDAFPDGYEYMYDEELENGK